jgi:hypothetical protein
MVFNATSYISYNVAVSVIGAGNQSVSVILWWSVLLVEETEVSGENHRPA